MSTTRSERAPHLTSQDGGPGTLVKSARDHSPAVAMAPHPVYAFSGLETAGHFAVLPGAAPGSFEAVYRSLPHKPLVTVAAEQHIDQQQQPRYRDTRDVELSQPPPQQRSAALLTNSSVERAPFPASPHHAAAIYHPHTSYVSTRQPPTIVDSASAVKRPRLMADFVFQPIQVEVEPKKAELGSSGSAYKPQVEAISPTLPADDAHGDKIRHSINELVSHIHRVDRDIQNMSLNIEKLKKKQEQIEEEAKKPIEEKAVASEANVDLKNQDISQAIYAENRKKVASAHAALEKFGKSTIMPMYMQPSDTEVYRQNKEKFATFKKTLIAYLKKQHHIARMRERYLTERYDKLLESWAKRLEKMEKRRLKDTKMREYFEKVFPEMKKQREDKERLQRVGGTRFSGYARSDANIEQIVENLHEQEEEERKMRNLAVIPPMLLDARQRQRRYHNEAGLLSDPLQINSESMFRTSYWTPEEKDIFREKYLQRPKNFGYIAAALENKTTSDCVLYYYTSKKSLMYKSLVRRHNATTRSSKRKFRPPANSSASAAAAAQAAVRDVKEEIAESFHESTVPVLADEKKSKADSAEKAAPLSDNEPQAVVTLPVNAGGNSGSAQEVPTSGRYDGNETSANGITKAEQVDGSQTAEVIGNAEIGMPHIDESRGHGSGVCPGDNSTMRRTSTPGQQQHPASGVSDRVVSDGINHGVLNGRPPLEQTSGRARSNKDVGLMDGFIATSMSGISLADNQVAHTGIHHTLSPTFNNCESVEPRTAAHLVELVIEQEMGCGSGRRRAGSRGSNCSDGTGSTVSAEEARLENNDVTAQPVLRLPGWQTDAGPLREVQTRHGTAYDERLAFVQLPTSANSPASMLAVCKVPNAIGIDVKSTVGASRELLGNDGKTVPVELIDSRLSLVPPQLNMPATAALLPGLAHKAIVSKLDGSQLCVRDVIHSAIEENLQVRPLVNDRTAIRSEELWKVYSQQHQPASTVKPPSTVPRAVGGGGPESSQVQDLSFKRHESLQPTSREGFSASLHNWSSEVSAARKLSPPPAHSNYIRQSAAAQVTLPPPQLDPRCQDPLKYLAEVAVQRDRVERAEISDRHTRGGSPLLNYISGPAGSRHARESEHNVLLRPQHSGGSITMGTPVLHNAGQTRHDGEPYLRDSDLMHEQSAAVPAGPQVITMAESVLKYLQPNQSQLAVMEHALAAMRSSASNNNPSQSILKSDFETAHQMSNLQRQQTHPQPASVTRVDPTGVHMQLSQEVQNGINSGLLISGSPPVSQISFTGSGNRPCNAASVIEAIITQQISSNCTVGSSVAGFNPSIDLVNRYLDQSRNAVAATTSAVITSQPLLHSQRRVVVNGTATLPNGIPIPSVELTSPRVNISERIEMERKTIAESRAGGQDNRLQLAGGRAVTLGETIDAMIQKDFGMAAVGDDASQLCEPTSGLGSDKKASLRMFLEHSADFEKNSQQGQDARLPSAVAGQDPLKAGAWRGSIAAGVGPASAWQKETLEHETSRTASVSLHTLDAVMERVNGPKSVAKTPPSQNAGLAVPLSVGLPPAFPPNVASLFGIRPTSASVSTTTVSSSSLPTVNIVLSQPLAMPFVCSSSLSTVPSSAQEALSTSTAPIIISDLVVGSTPLLKTVAGIPVQWPPVMAGGNVSVIVEGSVNSNTVTTQPNTKDESASLAKYWKKKLPYEHQQQQQEQSSELKVTGMGPATTVRSRPSSRSVTPVTTNDLDAGKSRTITEQTLRSTQQDLIASLAPRLPFSSTWLAASGSREGSTDSGPSSKSTSPRSPRAGGTDKPMSTIAMSHQTMSSLLQSKPVFAALDKGSADSSPLPAQPSVSNRTAAASSEIIGGASSQGPTVDPPSTSLSRLSESPALVLSPAVQPTVSVSEQSPVASRNPSVDASPSTTVQSPASQHGTAVQETAGETNDLKK